MGWGIAGNTPPHNTTTSSCCCSGLNKAVKAGRRPWHLGLRPHLLPPVTQVEKLSSFSVRIKRLDNLDTTVLNAGVGPLLIGSGRLSAVPLPHFLHPSVMCWARTHKVRGVHAVAVQHV
ncbi:unnamed protein product [Pleuronectes platessa]|uniref:Uncharacterized protein n=1 Tax=Pleuronectes platessa TaxID=8262 RepID=A0A9N7VM17_PLEPL|nr:unnamed protein product [Pleuronectes platessa]